MTRMTEPAKVMARLRVRAAIAINPMTSVLFGEESMGQVTTPTMIVSGGADTVTPALQEQLVPFTWLTQPERYLLLMRQGTHFSTIAVTETGSEAFDLPSENIGPDPELAQAYLAASSLAFLTSHLIGEATYQPLLTADGITQLNQDPINLSLVQSLTGPSLVNELGRPPRSATNEVAPPAVPQVPDTTPNLPLVPTPQLEFPTPLQEQP